MIARFAALPMLAIVVWAGSARMADAGYEQYALTYAYYGRYYAQLADPELHQPLLTEVLSQIQAGIDATTMGINTAHKPYYSVAKINFDYAWTNLYVLYSTNPSSSNAYAAYFYCYYASYAAGLAAQP